MSILTADEQTINSIIDAVERGIPRAVAIAYHTSGVSKAPTQAATVQHAVAASAKRTGGGSTERLEGMSTPQLIRNLIMMTEKYTYRSIARHMRDSKGVAYTPGAVRQWAYGSTLPYSEGVEAIRRFLIQYRDHKDAMKLDPAGIRERHPE